MPRLFPKSAELEQMLRCPKCQGFVDTEVVMDSRRILGPGPFCVNCGWRPTRSVEDAGGPLTQGQQEGSGDRGEIGIDVPLWRVGDGKFNHQPQLGAFQEWVSVILRPWAGRNNVVDVVYGGLRANGVSLAVLQGLMAICEAKGLVLKKGNLLHTFRTSDCRAFLDTRRL